MQSPEIEKWLLENTFYCPLLMARLTPEQCQRNRNKSQQDVCHLKRKNDRLKHCRTCRHWQEWQKALTAGRKKCNICQQEKPLEAFRLNTQTKLQVQTCEDCEKRYRQLFLEKTLHKRKSYGEGHR